MEHRVPLTRPYHSRSTPSHPTSIARGRGWGCFVGWVWRPPAALLPCHLAASSCRLASRVPLVRRLPLAGVGVVAVHRLASPRPPRPSFVVRRASVVSPSLVFASLVSPSSLSSHSPSTPRALAREAGRVVVSSRLPLVSSSRPHLALISPTSCPLSLGIVPCADHPMSSCS
jgi:hypothetical protein